MSNTEDVGGPQNTFLERQAFRIDVCGVQYSYPSEQMDPQTLDRLLLEQLQPLDKTLCELSGSMAPLIAASVEALLQSAADGAASTHQQQNGRRKRQAAGSAGIERAPPRALRKRTSQLASMAMDERQARAASFWELLCAESRNSADVDLDLDAAAAGIRDVVALLAGEVRDKLATAAGAHQEAEEATARQFDVEVAAAGSSGTGVVEFELAGGDGGSVVGAYASHGDAERPFSTGLVESLISGMNRLARRRLNVRHAWGVVLAPGAMRVCLVESDAIHVSSMFDLATGDGRRALAAMFASVSLAEAWRVGVDPTMRWRDDIACWEIECPSADASPDASRRRRRTTRNSLAVQQATTVVYAQRTPLFVADSFFGRFTRCFAVSRVPGAAPDLVLKDSWQLVRDAPDDSLVADEISVLRHIRHRLDSARPPVSAVYPRIACGGTVCVRTGGAEAERDTSQLVLGALDAYARWTVPHGLRRSGSAQRKRNRSQNQNQTHTELHPLRRLHRRMVTGPVGVPLQTLGTEHEVLAVLADAMQSHADILRCAGVLHRDISLNNIMAVRLPSGELRGMLIDFDHAADALAERNTHAPGNVGTGPFMSIANLEGLDVARTAVDDWESLLCLLFCLAANGPAAMDELARLFSHVNANGVADMKREIFASPRALDCAIAQFLNPSYRAIIRAIHALYAAAFQHSRCQGTARIFLRGNRNVDPVLRRAQYADEIQARCLGALRAIALETRSVSCLSDHLAAISHESGVPSADTAVAIPGAVSSADSVASQRTVEGALHSCGSGASSSGGDTTAVSCKSHRTLLDGSCGDCGADSALLPETPPPMMTAKSEGRASNCGIAESNASLATLLRETSESRYAPSLLLPARGGCHSTTTTLSTDATSKQHGPSYNTAETAIAAIAAAAAAATTLSQASTTVYNHLPPVQEDPHQSQCQLLLLRTKRKAKEEEQQDSPRTKRRKMIHQDV
ncbi:hypothetical protein LPJ72_003797, partial [Coemansia sp. Benny D160-2]